MREVQGGPAELGAVADPDDDRAPGQRAEVDSDHTFLGRVLLGRMVLGSMLPVYVRLALDGHRDSFRRSPVGNS